MFVKVHEPKKMLGADNRGSSAKLIDYLEKENNGKDEGQKENFFNYSNDSISAADAKEGIDNNNKNLGKKDYKFYMVSINPSHSEQQHLLKKITGKDVEKLSDLSVQERQKFFSEVKVYANEVMGDYARNFNRDNVTSEKDLVYFAKIETQRTFKHYDKEVLHNNSILKQQVQLEQQKKEANEKDAKLLNDRIKQLNTELLRTKSGQVIGKGTLKDGLNVHVHVVVSRNNVKQDTKLSPLSKSRGGKQMFNGKETMQGFNHEKFKMNASQRFNESYNYKPKTNDVYVSKSQRKDRSLVLNQLKNKLDLTRNIKGKIKGVVTEQTTSNMLQNERVVYTNTIQAAKNIVMVVKNPQSAVISIAKQIASRLLTHQK